jgi:hypothetical protein
LYVFFLISVFISTAKILNNVVIGSKLSVSICDAGPFHIADISTEVRGHTKIDINRGIHLNLKYEQSTLPSKLPVVLIADSNGAKFAAGVNALELIQESISTKKPSSVAQERLRLTSESGRDGIVLSFRTRIAIQKCPIAKIELQKSKPVSERACDLKRVNDKYKDLCRTLSEQVAILGQKVEKLTVHKTKAQEPVERRTLAVRTGPRRLPAPAPVKRSRPALDVDFGESSSVRKQTSEEIVQEYDMEEDDYVYYGQSQQQFCEEEAVPEYDYRCYAQEEPGMYVDDSFIQEEEEVPEYEYGSDVVDSGVRREWDVDVQKVTRDHWLSAISI